MAQHPIWPGGSRNTPSHFNVIPFKEIPLYCRRGSRGGEIIHPPFQNPGSAPVLHCASLLRMIFVSLVRTHEHRHIQNVSDFPQAKLDSKINACFLLNKHGDPQFLMHARLSTIHVYLDLKKSLKFCLKIF